MKRDIEIKPRSCNPFVSSECHRKCRAANNAPSLQMFEVNRNIYGLVSGRNVFNSDVHKKPGHKKRKMSSRQMTESSN